ncbi:RNA exonuclease 1 homolog [Glossina fuscipes]|uniref:RNA exonuclease 1 homolog n=1 Tax=Glossina fuscipes TaxID=7396 RepID=A0A9C5YYI0_9MUSC|nr:RNA exonuclease 1 homolog [Glossina fuscipes]XP_037891690.1 RNA exonuclease 1 homolog [Glossina fuscipes]
MLPSTGLFKSYICPYYGGNTDDNEDGKSTQSNIETSTNTCQRPYCHFKHIKKDEIEKSTSGATAVPEYKPTPKLLTLQELNLPIDVKRKTKLEYQPEKPGFNASPSKKRCSLDKAPIYIPAPTLSIGEETLNDNSQGSEGLDLKDYAEELDELSNILDNQNETTAKDFIENNTTGDSSKNSIKQKSQNENEKNENQVSQERSNHSEKREKRSSSNSQSKRHKHHKSSKCQEVVAADSKEHKRDVKREKGSSKRSDRDRLRKEKCENKPSSLKSSSSRHKSSRRSSECHEKNCKNSSTKPLSHGKDHLSDASPTTSKESKISISSNISKDKSASISSKLIQDRPDPESDTTALFATSDEEIRKECEMIFDQLEQEFATLQSETKKEPELERDTNVGPKRKVAQEEEQYSAAPQKKRVAYENADKQKSHATPSTVLKPDHRKNAIHSVFNRQNAVRREQEEEAIAQKIALREAEERVKEANEALRKAREKTLTPLIPTSYLTPVTKSTTRLIAPVSNMLALQRAKKKVEELKAEKKFAFTPAQTSKAGSRVAHKATVKTTRVEPEKQSKPPVLEANSTKISFNIRMQYYEMMVKHSLAIYPNSVDAWERAQAEELAVFKKCNTPVIYKSSAMLTINKLRKEAADVGNKSSQGFNIISHEAVLAGKLANNMSWSVQKKMKTDAATGSEPFDKLCSEKAYQMVFELHLTEELLVSNGFPRAGKRPGTAIIQNTKPTRKPNDTERYCSRCGKVFNLSMYDQICVDECNYHPKSTGYKRGFADNHHRCCQQPAGTPGCTYGNYHVITDYDEVENLTGYVTTIDKSNKSDGSEYVLTKKDIYALDCEMCYTTRGIELTRVTVVDVNSRIVYNALVKPDNKIVDYNTIYSGITEQMLANVTRNLRDVQAILMSMFHSNTILIGHSLESDLKALKLIHSVVVDTSVLFPHKMGPPKKRALKTLCIENLKRIIQENESGHDSAEDAEVCIQLVKFYLRNKIS